MMTPEMLEAMRKSGGAWWRSLSGPELLALYTAADDTYYRAHHAHAAIPPASFAELQSAYVLGHIAGFSPHYSGRAWPEIEPELARVWPSFSQLPWGEVTEFVKVGFGRGAASQEQAWRARLSTSDAAWNAA